MPIAEQSVQQQHSRLDLPKVKGLKDTMKMMMTNYKGSKQTMPLAACTKLGEITVSEGPGQRNHQSMMSQTVSSSFYNSKYKAHPLTKV